MIFWILVAAVVIAFIWGAWWNGPGSGFAVAGFTAIVSTLVFCAALVITVTVSPHYLDTWSSTKDTHSLTALKTDSSIEGRSYFLGGGYVDGKRVLNYIQTDGDAYYVKSSDADDSVIHESDGKPKVIHNHSVGGFWWLAPFPLGKGDGYDFYVPKGSVMSDYTVNNN